MMKQSIVYKMKAHAMQQIQGGHDELYGLLPTYCEMVHQTNP